MNTTEPVKNRDDKGRLCAITEKEVYVEMWLMREFASLFVLIVSHPFQIYDGRDLYKQACV